MPATIHNLADYRTDGSAALESYPQSTPSICVCECSCVSVGGSTRDVIHELRADLRWIGVNGVDKLLARFSACTVAAVLTYIEDEVDRGAPIRDRAALFIRLLEQATGRRVWRDEACQREEGLLARMMGLD
jgi:hypothetical protein